LMLNSTSHLTESEDSRHDVDEGDGLSLLECRRFEFSVNSYGPNLQCGSCEFQGNVEVYSIALLRHLSEDFCQ